MLDEGDVEGSASEEAGGEEGQGFGMARGKGMGQGIIGVNVRL